MRIVVCLGLAAVLLGAATAQDVVVRPGDVLNVTVLGETQLSGELTVGEDGMIALPLVGEIEVQGQPAPGVARLLTERLSDYLKDPQISVELVKRAPLKVVVGGAVKSPGLYFIACDSRLAEALAAAGGLATDANPSEVSFTHPGDRPLVLDFRLFLEQGDQTQNPLLESGDHIMVAEGPLEPENAARIIGQVLRPGAYELRGSVTPWDMVAKAGGLLPGANTQEAILRPDGGDPQVIDMAALLRPEAMTTAPVLKKGDTLVIPGFNTQVYVLGGVKSPGPYYVPAGARLLDAIAVAGGVTEFAQLNESYLLRAPAGGAGPALRQPVDLRKLLVEGDFQYNVDLQPGDTLFVPVRTPRSPGGSTMERAIGVLAPLLYLFL